MRLLSKPAERECVNVMLTSTSYICIFSPEKTHYSNGGSRASNNYVGEQGSKYLRRKTKLFALLHRCSTYLNSASVLSSVNTWTS